MRFHSEITIKCDLCKISFPTEYSGEGKVVFIATEGFHWNASVLKETYQDKDFKDQHVILLETRKEKGTLLKQSIAWCLSRDCLVPRPAFCPTD